jgi:glutaminyl-peptide cyclotransferase
MARLTGIQTSRKWISGLIAAALVLAACSVPQLLQQMAAARQPEALTVRVLAVYPHDTGAFTEGLEYHGGALYESTGYNGRSNFRKVDLATGQVLQQVPLDARYFGEGISLVGDQFLQLTWQTQIGFRYDAETFAPEGTFTYSGEGWGMCFDGENLYRSDGSSVLTIHAPATFAATGTVPVTLNGQPVLRINELECVGDVIYANVWYTNTILRIDKATGRVTAQIDASGLLTADEMTSVGSEGVLNGIAYNPDSDTFYVTGKLWPKLFEVEFVEEAD